jgi:hypothetical protein
MDELREIHLGIPLPNPEEPRATTQIHAAYESAIRNSG